MAKKIRVDFGGVSKEIKRGGGGRVHVPEGDYLLKIVDSEMLKSDKGKGFIWKFQIIEPKKYKGKTLRGYTSLKPEALWSLRNLIHAALGKNVAGKALDFDPSKLYGKIVGGAVEDNEFAKDGKTRITSEVSTCFPKEEINASEDEDEEDEDEDEEDEEEETEDEDEEEDEDLEDVEVEEL